MTEQPVRALSLWQPWAHIVASGDKRVENRSWEPPPWLIGQRFAIHAAKRWDSTGALRIAELWDQPCPRFDDVEFGAVIATVRLVMVATTPEQVMAHASEDQAIWFFGPYGWVLEDARPVKPVLCRGFQGLWTLPNDLELVER